MPKNFLVIPFYNFRNSVRLLTQIEFLYNVPVSLNVNFLQIVKEAASFTYKHKKCALCSVVFPIFFHVLCEVSDTVGK